MRFRRRTRDELDALDWVHVSRDPATRTWFLQWNRASPEWVEYPGGQGSVYAVEDKMLCMTPDPKGSLENWHHLCAVVGLQEAVARVFWAEVEEMAGWVL